jgi:20S proteasome alpha/beta subunit
MSEQTYSCRSFSADGTIPQANHASQAVNSSKITAVFRLGESDLLILVKSTGSEFDLSNRVLVVSDDILVCTAGVSSDCMYLSSEIRKIGRAWAQQYAESIPVHTLIKKIILLQHEYSRRRDGILACNVIVASKKLYMINPIGTLQESDTVLACGSGSNLLQNTEYDSGASLLKQLSAMVAPADHYVCRVVLRHRVS